MHASLVITLTFASIIWGKPSSFARDFKRQTTLCPAGNPNPSYTVQKGDTCTSISLAQNVSTLDFEAVNNQVDSKCTTLQLGSTVCMPPQCKVYKVKSGDTCDAIAHAHGLDITTFYDHNPGIDDPSCKNLEAGTNVCLDQPHGSNFPSPEFDPPSSSTTAHSSLPQGTVAPSSQCAKLYTVQPGDTCFEVEAKFGISDQNFHASNPNLTANCSNLVLGNAYCVQPLQSGANSTSGSNDTAVAVGEVMAGSECTNIYKAQMGDNCTFIEHKYNITNKQFHAVNPNVYQNCTNLLAGVDYCVQPLNMTSTSPSSTSSKSIASHTRSSTSSSRA